MKHLDRLEQIALSDVNVIKMKESTYRGSWKRAGGRSAWFMMRRNMDRLLTMMAAPDAADILQDYTDHLHGACESGGEIHIDEKTLLKFRSAYVAEDIFLKIVEKPDGSDGTVLAALRDLRRYAMLVEAEMSAEGVTMEETYVVSAPPAAADAGSITVTVAGQKFVHERRVPRFDGEDPPNISYEQAANSVAIAVEEVKRSVDAPWQLTSAPRYALGDKFYDKLTAGLYRLSPFVEATLLPAALTTCYSIASVEGVAHSGVWVLRLDRAPEGVQNWYQRVTRELNAHEYELCRNKYLYQWVNDKYQLKEKFSYWGREPS